MKALVITRELILMIVVLVCFRQLGIEVGVAAMYALQRPALLENNLATS